MCRKIPRTTKRRNAVFVAVWRGRDSPHLSATTAVPWPMPVRQLTSGTISAVKPMFSPDGKSLLFLSETPEPPGIGGTEISRMFLRAQPFFYAFDLLWLNGEL